MAAKGTALDGAAITAQGTLEITGLPTIYFTQIGEIESRQVLAKMADQTMQVTGQEEPSETTVRQYVHHDEERLALEAWYALCLGGGTGHKLTGTLYLNGADGQPRASFLLTGMILRSRKIPEQVMGDDGEPVEIEWGLSIDDVTPLS